MAWGELPRSPWHRIPAGLTLQDAREISRARSTGSPELTGSVQLLQTHPKGAAEPPQGCCSRLWTQTKGQLTQPSRQHTIGDKWSFFLQVRNHCCPDHAENSWECVLSEETNVIPWCHLKNIKPTFSKSPSTVPKDQCWLSQDTNTFFSKCGLIIVLFTHTDSLLKTVNNPLISFNLQSISVLPCTVSAWGAAEDNKV